MGVGMLLQVQVRTGENITYNPESPVLAMVLAYAGRMATNHTVQGFIRAAFLNDCEINTMKGQITAHII